MFEEVAEGAKRIAGRVVVGGALGLAALAPLPVSAQQVAANTPAAATAWPATVAECKKIQDLAKSTQCIVEVGGAINRAETQRLNASTQALNDEGACVDKLKELRTQDPSIVERGKAVLAGTPARQYGFCKLVKVLTNS